MTIPSILEGKEFRYSSADWSRIDAASPQGADRGQLKSDLQDEANFYLISVATSQSSAYVLDFKARCATIAVAAETFLQALAERPFDPIHAGFHDEKKWNEMIAGIERVVQVANESRQHYGMDVSVGENGKKERRQFIEHLVQLWLHHGLRQEIDNTGRLLDFLEAATRPVLVPADSFGAGISGRDALGKVIDAVRKRGISTPRLDRDGRLKPLTE